MVIKEEEETLTRTSYVANSLQPEDKMGSSVTEFVVDEEESKQKPLLQLKYQGFNIFGKCLCVVVEPWLPIQAVPSITSILPSMAPLDDKSSSQLETRAQTPLFLPGHDTHSETPAPQIPASVLPLVPLFRDTIDPESDCVNEDALMEFSQALNYAGDHRGGPEDDDEIDGAVFFGDADEAREL